MDLGLFGKSKGPSRRGGLDLGLFGKSKGPSNCGGWAVRGGEVVGVGWGCGLGLDFGLPRKSKVPSMRGGLDLGLPKKSKVPSKRGGLDLGLLKTLEPNTRGG